MPSRLPLVPCVVLIATASFLHAEEPAGLPRDQPIIVYRLTGDSADEDLGYPTIAGGHVYVGDRGGAFYAFDAVTGVREWKAEHGGDVTCPSAVSDELVFLNSDLGLTALDRTSGRVVWHSAIDEGAGGSPQLVGDRVLAAGNDGVAYAYEQRTGETVWTRDFLVAKYRCGASKHIFCQQSSQFWTSQP